MADFWQAQIETSPVFKPPNQFDNRSHCPKMLKRTIFVLIMPTATETIENFVNTEYKYGFSSDIETEAFSPGLNEATVHRISEKKNEPEFLRDSRLKAYKH